MRLLRALVAWQRRRPFDKQRAEARARSRERMRGYVDAGIDEGQAKMWDFERLRRDFDRIDDEAHQRDV